MASFDLGDVFNLNKENEVSLEDLNILESVFEGDFEITNEVSNLSDLSSSTPLSPTDVLREIKKAMDVMPPSIKTIQSGQKNKRFKELTQNDLEDLKDRRQSKATKKATQWGLNVFQEWSMEVLGEETDFKSIKLSEMDARLGKFYAEAAPKLTESRLRQLENTELAAEYNKSSFKSIKSAINRHLKDVDRDCDIVRDRHGK